MFAGNMRLGKCYRYNTLEEPNIHWQKYSIWIVTHSRMTIGQVHSSATCHMSSLWLKRSFFLRPSGVARILGLRMLAHNLAFDIASLLADGVKVRSCWVSAKKGIPNQFPTKDTLLISYISLFLGWQGQIFEIGWLYIDSSNMEPDWKTNPYCRTSQKSLQPLLLTLLDSILRASLRERF